MNLPTAGPPADTETLCQQIATAREALIAAVGSLDGAMEAAQDRDSNYPLSERRLQAPMERLVLSLCDSLGSVRNAERWLGTVERALERLEKAQ